MNKIISSDAPVQVQKIKEFNDVKSGIVRVDFVMNFKIQELTSGEYAGQYSYVQVEDTMTVPYYLKAVLPMMMAAAYNNVKTDMEARIDAMEVELPVIIL